MWDVKGIWLCYFESQEDALKILHDTNAVCLKGKKLSIAQAVRKHRASGPTKRTTPHFAVPLPMSCDSEYLNTSAGFPYSNGVAYFQHPYCPNMSPPAPSGLSVNTHITLHLNSVF
ncbi:Protein boule-like [Dissostichus eleginoides]|uniref:Protein boule-like n=1 Tax=Dissostichus eleginoides TaxID=100907 RepID=A0AAD9B5Q5_DISEL|nr:Protein boule-like [Dissostichus eleginoides]